MNYKNILLRYLLFFFVFLLIILIGVSNVFAQTIQGWAKNVNLYTDVNLLTCSSSSCSSSVSLTADYFYDSESLVKYNNFVSSNHNITNYGDMILNYHRYLPGYLYSSTSYVCFSSNVTLTNSQIDLYVGTYSDTINKVGNLSYHNVLVQTLDNHPYSPGDQYNKCYAIVDLFSPSVEGQNIGKVYKSTSTISSRTYLIGEQFQSLGLYSGSLNNTINSAITNSGLATSSSIEELQDNLLEVQEEIITNQNQNTQQQIESQKVCTSFDKTNIIKDGYYLNSSGTEAINSSYGITEYLTINNNSTLKSLTSFSSSTSNTCFCFYNVNKSLISCSFNRDLIQNANITIPDNASYVRFSIQKSLNQPQMQICKNGNQALNDNINNLNDNINNDDTSQASSEASDFFGSFNTNTFGLTSIITAPLNLIQSLTSKTCTPLHLPLPYLNNQYLDLPCMSTIYSQYFGTFFTLYQTITYGIIAYWVCVRIFNLVKDFKNPEHDEIEVVDL